MLDISRRAHIYIAHDYFSILRKDNIMNTNNQWWEEHSGGLNSVCVECSTTDVVMSDRILTEMIQKNIITPQDITRVNDPTFPEDKRQLILSLLKR